MVGIDRHAIFIARDVPHRPEMLVFGIVNRVFLPQNLERFQHIFVGKKLRPRHIEAISGNF